MFDACYVPELIELNQKDGRKRKSCLVTCASDQLGERSRAEPRGLTPTPSRDSDLCHSLCWQLHLSSTPAPPQRRGPDERWSWQGWGTKIWVMLWLPMPHWQISQRRGAGSRLKMMTRLTWRINDFHFQCQNVNNKIKYRFVRSTYLLHLTRMCQFFLIIGLPQTRRYSRYSIKL